MSLNITAGLLITGNEVLSAKTKDTNGPFIGRLLSKIGIPICASMICGDSKKDLLDCLHYLSNRCDVIFMTGGLGPTSDDLTAEVVAEFFGKKTIFFSEAWENCLDAYKKFNRTYIPESNKKQSYLPEGASLLPNKVGTAVGFKVTGLLEHSKNALMPCSIYCLPGVPYEMESMFLDFVYPQLIGNNFLPLVKTWQVFLMGESAMQSAIDTAEKKLLITYPDCTISYQAQPSFVTYSVTLFPKNNAELSECENYLKNEFIPAVERNFGKHILYESDKKVAQYLIEGFLQKNLSLSLLEGPCGGAISKELTYYEGAENVLKASLMLSYTQFSLSRSFFHAERSDFLAADISVIVYGSPDKNHATQAFPHGKFSLFISISKNKIKDVAGLEDKLKSFSWEKSYENGDKISFQCKVEVTPRYSKDVQQNRVTFHVIGFLLLMLRYL